MSEIKITQVDETQVKEKIGKKREPVHESIFKEYGIPLKSKNAEPLRPIPASWTKEIIDKNVSSINIATVNVKKDDQKRLFTILLNSEDDAKEFEKHFQTNMFKSINTFIEDKDENPTFYNRNIITTTEIDGLQFRISY